MKCGNCGEPWKNGHACRRQAVGLVLIAGLVCAAVLLFFLGGCSLDRDKKRDQEGGRLFIVACCKEADDSYPDFLPPAHVQLCEEVRVACHDSDCQRSGDTWLGVGVDCGRRGYIGDQYYPPNGY